MKNLEQFCYTNYQIQKHLKFVLLRFYLTNKVYLSAFLVTAISNKVFLSKPFKKLSRTHLQNNSVFH